MLHNNDIVWLAAWLEGEGWFGLSKGSIAIQATSTDLDVVTRAGQLMGARSVHPKKLGTNPNHQQAYTVRVTGNRAEKTMRLVRPHMGRRRGEKIDFLLQHRADGPKRRSAASTRRWADPELRAIMSAAIAKAKPKGDPRWSEALRKAWITRRAG